MNYNYKKLNAFILLLIMSTTLLFSQKKALLLGRGTLGDYVTDQALNDYLTGKGYTVDFITALPADVSGYDGYLGIVISESISSSTGNGFSTAEYPIPCINFEGWALLSDRWGGWVENLSDTDPKTDWNQKSDAGADGQSIIILDNTHYITQDYSIDDEVQWTNSEDATAISNTNPVSFMEVNVLYDGKLAQAKSYQEDGFYTMVTVDSSALFPNRMFVWGIIDAAVTSDGSEASFTGDFYNIFNNAVEWAFEGKNIEVGIPSVNDNFSMEVFPNPVTDKLNVRLFSPKNDETLKITLHSITGQEVKVLAEKKALYGYNFITVDVTNLPGGLYFVKMETGDQTFTKKLLIK